MKIEDVLHELVTAPDDDDTHASAPMSFRDVIGLPRLADAINQAITGEQCRPGEEEASLRADPIRDQLSRIVGQLSRLAMLKDLPTSPHTIQAQAELDCLSHDLVLDLASYGATVFLNNYPNH